ncbi:hypothetical protein CEXT_611401 [Caerostris extrusa]|uniref:Uncharacterized protein n=1 Tax=Caerostris extrusa TaxID=172846 RepID=A0AAV4N6J5_CAEEX|nr:hypothetical protein CEXT_611401 [Caerostris extrusa]
MADSGMFPIEITIDNKMRKLQNGDFCVGANLAKRPWCPRLQKVINVDNQQSFEYLIANLDVASEKHAAFPFSLTLAVEA